MKKIYCLNLVWQRSNKSQSGFVACSPLCLAETIKWRWTLTFCRSFLWRVCTAPWITTTQNAIQITNMAVYLKKRLRSMMSDKHELRHQVLTADHEFAVVWVVTPSSLVEAYRHFRGSCCLHHHGRWCRQPWLSDTNSVLVLVYVSGTGKQRLRLINQHIMKTWWQPHY